ncbi:MAG TPA: response regulator transcription factor [Vicinamibacteria bacterium]|nr:response regulator transcription factor [Vicinamibacteria bacterium]
MSAPKKIVLVDDDPHIRRLIEQSLPAPEFQVLGFGDGRDALMRLHEIVPDLIVADIMMPEMDGRTFFQVVKRSQELRHVPFIFLSAIHASDQIVATMEAGADDFVNKPFSPIRLLAKVRAILRLAGRTAAYAEDRRHHELTGNLGAKGTLPLVKFCESVRLSGRLTVTAPGVERWADFLGGELLAAGSQPGTEGDDAIEGLLSMTAGGYRIEQRRLDPGALPNFEGGGSGLAEDPAVGLPSPEGPAHLPGGLLSKLAVRGAPVTIQTEAENRPDFMVTTLVARSGQVIRKIESSWPHPLQRRADQAAAEAQVRRQHERVAATVGELASEPPAPAGGPATTDGALLAWAVSFIAEQTRDLLGSVMTTALLRRTWTRLARKHESLRSLRVVADGRVLVNHEQAALPGPAVPAVAEWVASFLTEAGALAEKAGKVRIRQATRMMEADLERIGFYAALNA